MKKLDNLIKDLEKILGENLVSAFIFGSKALVADEDLKSNINLMIILNKMEASDLKLISKDMKKWVSAKNPLPVIFDKTEWLSSFDVYAMEYADIKDSNKILYGEDLITSIEVKKSDLRFQCELEVKNLSMKLRNNFMMNCGSNRRLSQVLTPVVKSVSVIFRTILRLNSIEVPVAQIQVVEEVAKLTGIDKDLFLKLVDVKEGRDKFKGDGLNQAFSKLVDELRELLKYVNGINI